MIVGSYIPTATTNALLNFVDFNYSLKDAIFTPRAHTQLVPDFVEKFFFIFVLLIYYQVAVEQKYPNEAVNYLQKLNHKVRK